MSKLVGSNILCSAFFIIYYFFTIFLIRSTIYINDFIIKVYHAVYVNNMVLVY